MIARGCFLLTLVFHHVLSLPVSSNHVDKEDAKQVMKCIVEVIADTLSKPSPIPISQECLDSLRGDERIISILRHQNLLKELQELASQGASERAQQQEKGDHLEDQIPAVLEDALDKDVPADQSMLDALKKPASYTETRRVDLREQALPAQKREAELSENEVEESAESDGESLEGNEVEEPKEEEKREGGPEKLIPASLSLEEEKATVGTEGSKEEMQLKSRETSKPVSTEGGEDIESDGVFQGKAESEENETEKEDNSEADKDGSRTDAATSVPDVHKVKNSLQGEGGDQQEQTEEKRSSEEEEEEEKCCQEGEEGGEADDQEGEKNGEDSKRWSRMDELAEKLSSRKRSQGEEEEERSAESSQTSQPKGLLTRDLQRHRHAAQHHSKEDSSREERSRAQETVAHSEADERREEEGSASRKAEDQEIESLAAIESELENVAQKLHELRKG
ncbi:chromogranin-A isoform X1 [Lepisosteus oculatus]|uniref:chromogranin-A isoform X1 n=1 Tax=Lepisosteus oculatus TaxID=7918 RepID=UPI0037103BE6